MKKVLIVIILILDFFSTSFVSLADDEIIENDVTLEDISQSIETSTSDIPSEPIINARHAIVFDRSSKQPIYGKKETEKCKMASTTKIMTAIVTLENVNLNDTVIVSSKAAHTGGSRLGLSTNDTITVENLLYGLMLKSRE